MNHNGALAFIFIFLMTWPPSFRDGSLVSGTDLYSIFKKRIEATSDLAEQEFKDRTSDTLDAIYDLAGKILTEELKRAQLISDAEIANITSKGESSPDKTSDGGNGNSIVKDEPSPNDASDGENSKSTSKEEPSASANDASDGENRAVASESTNTTTDGEKHLELMNSPMIVSNADQPEHHRQARKMKEANRTFRRNRLHRRRHRRRINKEFYPRSNTIRRQGSRPLSSMLDAERGKLSAAKYREKAYDVLKQQQAMKNIDDFSELGENRNSFNAASGQKMNCLAVESIDVADGGNRGADDSGKAFETSSVKWQEESQIDGNKNNLQKTSSWSNGFGENKSNGLIQSFEAEGDLNKEYEVQIEEGLDEIRQTNVVESDFLHGNGKSKLHTRDASTYPGIYTQTVGQADASSILQTGKGLNDAISEANNLLLSMQDVAKKPITPSVSIDANPIPHNVKDLQPLPPLNIPLPVMTTSTEPNGASNITNVMEQVLDDLETLKTCATEESQPEGSPCDIIGSWNSETIGLQFRISIASSTSYSLEGGKLIDIEIYERVPPRQHDLMGCDWYITGSTVKQVGGPFYMSALKADKYTVGTFAGLCKLCGGIPTIFGSWTFVYPAKDCQDISIAVENKRDVLRKDTLEAKRKQRRNRNKLKSEKKCLF